MKTFLFLLAVPPVLIWIGPPTAKYWTALDLLYVFRAFVIGFAMHSPSTAITIRDVFQSIFRHIKVVWPDLNASVPSRLRDTPIGLYDSCIMCRSTVVDNRPLRRKCPGRTYNKTCRPTKRIPNWRVSGGKMRSPGKNAHSPGVFSWWRIHVFVRLSFYFVFPTRGNGATL